MRFDSLTVHIKFAVSGAGRATLDRAVHTFGFHDRAGATPPVLHFAVGPLHLLCPSSQYAQRGATRIVANVGIILASARSQGSSRMLDQS